MFSLSWQKVTNLYLLITGSDRRKRSLIFLPIRRLYEDIGPEEKEEGVREDGLDRPGVGLAIIILLCSLLALIVIFQSYKLCRATHRHYLDLIFSTIKQNTLKNFLQKKRKK